MTISKKRATRPAGLNYLIAFQDEPRPFPLCSYERWVPWLCIKKYARSQKWNIEFDPYEGSHCSKYLTPLGAAVANHVASLGDAVFNSAFGRSSHGFARNTSNILFNEGSTSYMQFETRSLSVACTVASRLLFLPEECYTEARVDHLPNDPISKALSSCQLQSGTGTRPMLWEEI